MRSDERGSGATGNVLISSDRYRRNAQVGCCLEPMVSRSDGGAGSKDAHDQYEERRGQRCMGEKRERSREHLEAEMMYL
jgi:hypothetical protein